MYKKCIMNILLLLKKSFCGTKIIIYLNIYIKTKKNVDCFFIVASENLIYKVYQFFAVFDALSRIRAHISVDENFKFQPVCHWQLCRSVVNKLELKHCIEVGSTSV